MFTYDDLRRDPSLLAKFKSRGKVPLKCCHCGSGYEKTKHYALTDAKRGDRSNFCSRQCSNDAQRSSVRIPCTLCGIEVSKRPVDLRSSDHQFCSRSCSAKFSNQHRERTSRDQQRLTLRATLAARARTRKAYRDDIEAQDPKPAGRGTRTRTPEGPRLTSWERKKKKRAEAVWGPSSRIFHCVCAHSGRIFVSRTAKKYHSDFRDLYSRRGRAAYNFTFNVYDYPELFELNLLEEHGWYFVGGRFSGKDRPLNKGGVSRDHRVSVSDAIKNGYDPFYIKHPLNCKLMLHAKNNVKKGQSEMDYGLLVSMVDRFEQERRNDQY